MTQSPDSIPGPERPLVPAEAAFDLDGVVVDVMTPFLRLLAERHHRTGLTTNDITEFDLARALGLPETVVAELVDDLLWRPIQVGARPYPGAGPVLARLAQAAPLLFVTSRPRAEPIQDWFAAAFPQIPADRFHIVATGDPFGKLEALRDHGRRVFFDDHPEACRQLRLAGIQAILFDQPWNRRDRDLPRVQDWRELARWFGLDIL
jgi:hypothetical protein